LPDHRLSVGLAADDNMIAIRSDPIASKPARLGVSVFWDGRRAELYINGRKCSDASTPPLPPE
jgi:hypothetical protein